MIHKTVLLKESIDSLNIKKGDTLLDCTVGSGGHLLYALEKNMGAIKVIGLDRDSVALERSKNRLKEFGSVTLLNSDYRNLKKALKDIDIHNVDRIILDLGLSSDQFETSGRGFTFKKDEPLLMTFKSDLRDEDLTARQIVNNWSEESISDILYGYGEEKFSRRIAKSIILYREKKSIETTGELVEIIRQAVPSFYRNARLHPATKSFQALRITVNDELNALKDGLMAGLEVLSPGGRMAVISFHSLEDRIVKNFNNDQAKLEKIRIINKRPMTPSEEEVQINPRSRSAKLRIIEKK